MGEDTVYRVTKQICGGQQRGKTTICDKQGVLSTNEQNQEERWAEQFQEVLNKSVATQNAEDEFVVSTEPPAKQNIMAINHYRSKEQQSTWTEST